MPPTEIDRRFIFHRHHNFNITTLYRNKNKNTSLNCKYKIDLPENSLNFLILKLTAA